VPSEARARRIADRIFRELGELFQRSVADPRLVGLTVTGVDVDREYSYATIYVSGTAQESETMKALEQARGYLRSELARRIPMRVIPQLRFRWDDSSDRGARVDELLDRLREERGDAD
jgi:ribosome-binding factor A